MKGVYVDLPEDLYRQAKHFMAETDMKLKELVRQALEEFLSRKKGGKR